MRGGINGRDLEISGLSPLRAFFALNKSEFADVGLTVRLFELEKEVSIPEIAFMLDMDGDASVAGGVVLYGPDRDVVALGKD